MMRNAPDLVKTISFLGILLFAPLLACDSRDGNPAGLGPTTPDSQRPVLGSIAVSSGVVSPPFVSLDTSYTVGVANSVTAISITATALPGLGITVNGAPVTSGSPSGSIQLGVGPNTVTIVVSNGTSSRTYIVLVTRAAPALE